MVDADKFHCSNNSTFGEYAVNIFGVTRNSKIEGVSIKKVQAIEYSYQNKFIFLMQSSTQINFFKKVETMIMKIFYFEILLSIPNGKFYVKVYMILYFKFKEKSSLALLGRYTWAFLSFLRLVLSFLQIPF